MRAILLAAGLGTRLRPLTDHTPKCQIEIAGKPLLAWWLDHMERSGVTDLIVNLHHHPQQVRDFFRGYDGPIAFKLFEEPVLLGSAGTLSACREWLGEENDFLILYGDNLTNARLGPLVEYHKSEEKLLTVGLFHAENPRACGIVELRGDSRGEILSFTEKPSQPVGDLASAGLFVADSRLLDDLPREPNGVLDFGRDIMPTLLGGMNGIVIDGYLRDIGTHESLAAARQEWPSVLEEGRFWREMTDSRGGKG